jgi:DNA-binding transcriptional LysR family regulator
VFSDASLCLDAAISGSGVFLTFETLAVDPLANGRLVEPFARRRATRNAYWLVTAEGRKPYPPVRHFIGWLKRQIAAGGLGGERDG